MMPGALVHHGLIFIANFRDFLEGFSIGLTLFFAVAWIILLINIGIKKKKISDKYPYFKSGHYFLTGMLALSAAIIIGRMYPDRWMGNIISIVLCIVSGILNTVYLISIRRNKGLCSMSDREAKHY